jgi:hypothetical protein
MQSLLSFAFGTVVDGSETGGNLFNAIDGGADVTANSYVKSVGGHVLSDQNLAQIDGRIASERNLEQQQASVKDRLVDLNNPRSLASRLVVNLPSSRGELVSGVKRFALAIPNFWKSLASKVSGSISSINTPAYAADTTDLYGIKQFGFTETELDTDPLSLTPAKCAEIAAANQQAIDGATDDNIEQISDSITDLCAFDKTFIEASDCIFTADDDCGINSIESTGSSKP